MLFFLTKTHGETSDISSMKILSIFFAFSLCIFFLSIIKKIYYRYKYHKRYYIFPRMSVKGITNVAMTISLSICSIVLLSVLTSNVLAILFRAYPGWRVTIEGVLVQLGGLLYGPIIGIFLGMFTDILTIALTNGMFHYGYFIAVISYGMLAGFIKTMANIVNGNLTKFTIIGIISVIATYIIYIAFIYQQPTENFKLTFFDITVIITKQMTFFLLGPVILLIITISLVSFFIFERKKMRYLLLKSKYNIRYKSKINYFKSKVFSSSKKDKIILKHARWLGNKSSKMLALQGKIARSRDQINPHSTNNWFYYLTATLYMSVINGLIINSIIIPYFDVTFSSFDIYWWLGFRLVLFPVLLLTNIVLIFPIFKSVGRLIKYDYTSDMYESIKTPFMT